MYHKYIKLLYLHLKKYNIVMSSNPIVHRYAVAFDSVLGLQVKNYIARCLNAETAARDFAECRAQLYGLKCIDKETELIMSDDCEAGGLLGFSIPKATFDDLATDMRVAVLWDSMTDESRPSNLIVFPRCERQTHYIRYGRAVELQRSGTSEWEFKMERNHANGEQRVKRYTYDQVRKLIKPADMRALVSKDGETPGLSTRLAFGSQYVISTDTLPKHMHVAISTYRQEAIDLFKEMSGLPNVPALSLVKTLQLGTVTDKDFRDRCFCRWETDEPNKRYIFTTGLRSSRTDMQLLED